MEPKEARYLRDVVLPAVRNVHERAELELLAAEVAASELANDLSAEVAAGLDVAVRSTSSIVRSHASRWLYRFAARQEAAAALVWQLFRSGSGPTRLSLVQSIAFNDVHNEPLERAVVLVALQDKLPRIRIFAADRALTRGWRDMVPAIDAAAATMPTASGRASLQRCSRLLVDGFDVRPSRAADDRIQMTVKCRGGATMLSVPASVIGELGHAEVARRARLRCEWPPPALEPTGESWDPVPDPTDLSKNVGLDPELVAARLAFAEFEKSGVASSTGLHTLTTVLSGSYSDARQSAAAWLVVMSQSDAKVAEAILQGFEEWNALARSGIVRNVQFTDDLPLPFVLEVARKALRDSDASVRRSAGNVIRSQQLRTLLPDLIKAAATDPDPETANSLAENLAFLQDGYTAKRLPRNRYEVRVAIGRGAQLFEMPSKVADAIGFPEIARRVRARHEHKGRRAAGKFWDPI